MHVHVHAHVHASRYVFLSNTGEKNAVSVQQKFLSAPYLLDGPPVPLECILTAAEAQVHMQCTCSVYCMCACSSLHAVFNLAY